MKLALAFGTRPEIVKLAPLILEARERDDLDVVTINTAQHGGIVTDSLEWFGITPDMTLTDGKKDSTLNGLSARLLVQLDDAFTTLNPDAVLVQGDTTTVCMAAHAATNLRIPVIHLEAGLRSSNRWSPFPEELNRRTVSALASLHLTPTDEATDNLLHEGVNRSDIVQTGNTVIDALLWTAERPIPWGHSPLAEVVAQAPASASSGAGVPSPDTSSNIGVLNTPEQTETRAGHERRLVLITCHRRENWGHGLTGVAQAVATLATKYPDINFVWPLHPNPTIREAVAPILKNTPNTHLVDALSYPNFVDVLSHATLVLSDSGGVQEEAPSLGSPVLVLRESTERHEGVRAGCAKLIGTDPARIVAEVSRHLDDDTLLSAMRGITNPYGDGHAVERAIQAITSWYASYR